MRRRFRGITFLVMALWVIGLTWVVIFRPDLIWDQEASANVVPPGIQKRLKEQIGPEIQRVMTPKPKTIALAKNRIERATKLTKDLFEESKPYAVEALFPEGAILFDELDQYVDRSRFKITEQSLKKMQSEGVPNEVLEALKNIRDRDFVVEENFVTALSQTILGTTEDDYTPLILKHAQYSGYFLRTALEAGQPLLDYKLYFDRQKLIEDRTAIDMRAMSVRVDEVVGVAGYIKPYSWVDILVTFREPQTTKTVLRDILVLAVGDTVERKKNEQEGQKKVSVVTLQVTPEQAEILTLATSEGKLRLALRNPLDIKAKKTPGANLKSLLGSNTPRRKRAPSRKVTVIKGSEVKTQFFR